MVLKRNNDESRYLPHTNTLHFIRYEVHEPVDGQFGVKSSGGNWTGVVGTLQHEQADFSMDLTLSPQRAAVVEFCRPYIGEELAILSLKPKPLPEYMALVRPFEGETTRIVVVLMVPCV